MSQKLIVCLYIYMYSEGKVKLGSKTPLLIKMGLIQILSRNESKNAEWHFDCVQG